jgi:hypothetical protein
LGQVLETKALGNKISAWPEKIMKEKSYKPQAPSCKLDSESQK